MEHRKIKCAKCGATGSTKCFLTRSVFLDSFYEGMLSHVLKLKADRSEDGKLWDVTVEFRQLFEVENMTENEAVKQTLLSLVGAVKMLEEKVGGCSLETYSCINHDWEYVE